MEDTVGNTLVRAKRPKKAAGIFLALIAAVAVSCYIIVAVYYGGHFYPQTIINGRDFSNADKAGVSVGLMSQMQDYRLQVTGRDSGTLENVELLQISAQDVDLKVVISDTDVQSLLREQGCWFWPIHIWGSHVYTLWGAVEIDEDKLAAILERQEFCKEENMVAPEDAYIEGYSEEEHSFKLVPEVRGTQLAMEKVQESIRQAILQELVDVDLEEQGCYAEPSVTVGDADLKQSLVQANKWLETEITYDWNGNEVVLSGEEIKGWVILKNGRLFLDEDAVAEFVEKNAREYDTYGKTRIFHTTLGYDLSLPGGAFGWLTDREAETKALIKLIEAGTVGSREPEYASKGPWKGMNDIGNTYVEADMTHQHLYLYQQGSIVLETDFVSGNMSNGCVTPEGVFGLTYKTTNAVLRGADYETPVTYWMPFNGNVGMHDATWRDTFGGDIYLTDGSHGCLNLPLDKAGEIYQYMTEGFPIICYYYPPGVLPEETQDLPEEE